MLSAMLHGGAGQPMRLPANYLPMSIPHSADVIKASPISGLKQGDCQGCLGGRMDS